MRRNQLKTKQIILRLRKTGSPIHRGEATDVHSRHHLTRSDREAMSPANDSLM
jgi:hypothetical protein